MTKLLSNLFQWALIIVGLMALVGLLRFMVTG